MCFICSLQGNPFPIAQFLFHHNILLTYFTSIIMSGINNSLDPFSLVLLVTILDGPTHEGLASTNDSQIYQWGGIAVASFLFLDKLGDTVVEEWCSALM